MNKKETNTGFTIIEMLVAMSITVILAGALLGLQYLLAQNREVAIDNYFSVDAANTNINAMVREIRTARISNSGAYPIYSAGDNELIFFSDIDFDGDAERIRYTRSGTSIERGLIEPFGQPATYPEEQETTKIISDIVRNGTDPLFEYYNEDWPADTTNNPLTAPFSIADIKLVKVRVIINSNEGEENNYTLESFAQIRTLKDNL